MRVCQPGTVAFHRSMTSVIAYDDGVAVGAATFLNSSATKQEVNFVDGTVTNQGAYTAVFTGHFTSIDSVTIQAGSQHIGMDDFLLQYPGDGDVMQVAKGTAVAALIAGAHSDGHGGTLLTVGDGTVTLVGVDPTSLTADMFV